ncbi:hypothetical protein QZM48_04155 [Burkholderia orbicola]|uniref:hypothetical protein n=1 Tax=Burkholderia orbicola TaxID=2978683 RepID=UPI002651BC74|nr:hypothetical protein [Burkholderia orbicola]MDN7729199.1 hypothetical protein [Burkholderia orbicola]
MTTAYPETNAEVIEKALYCLKHGEMESVENWLDLLRERLTTDKSRADALTDAQIIDIAEKHHASHPGVDEWWEFRDRQDVIAFARAILAASPVEQHEAAPADAIESKLRVLMGAVNAYEKATGIGGWYAERIQESCNAILKGAGSNVRFGISGENPIAQPAPSAPLEGTGNGADERAAFVKLIGYDRPDAEGVAQDAWDSQRSTWLEALDYARAPRTEVAGAVVDYKLPPETLLEQQKRAIAEKYFSGAPDVCRALQCIDDACAAMIAPQPPSTDAAAAPADERAAFEAWWKANSPSNFDYASALAGYLARASSANETGAEGLEAAARRDDVNAGWALYERLHALMPDWYPDAWEDLLPKYQRAYTDAAATRSPAQADARVGLADALRRAREELSIVEWENDPPNRVVKLFDEIDALLQGANHA